jgi:hypothetical protein
MKKRGEYGDRHKHEGGTVLVFVTISLAAFLGIAALATETGRVWQAKNQLQSAADSAALAGVGNLLKNDFTTVDEDAARAAGLAYGPLHKALGNAVEIAASDLEVGSWDLASESFTPMPGGTDPHLVRAVRARTRRDENNNGVIPAVFGQAVGYESFSVAAEAVAYWGVAGGARPGAVDLPISIDCCAVSGSSPGAACLEDYCQTIASNTPNPCPLSTGGTATCLEFHSTSEQNACWTELDGDSSSISTAGLTSIVEAGNTHDVEGSMYVDNGTKTPLISDIYDRFHGLGSFSGSSGGVDSDSDGLVDSWVVTIPVIECQNPGDQCASGNTQDLVGFICFEVKEVIVTPDKLIKGNFLCSTDSRCENGGLTPGGGLHGGLSAEYPVIVH